MHATTPSQTTQRYSVASVQVRNEREYHFNQSLLELSCQLHTFQAKPYQYSGPEGICFLLCDADDDDDGATLAERFMKSSVRS